MPHSPSTHPPESPPSRILVTGAAGFIGAHLAEALLREGHSVLGVDNFDPLYARSIKEARVHALSMYPGFRFAEADITQADFLPGEQVDAVMHLAALPGTLTSVDRPEAVMHTNVHGTACVLAWMRAQGCRKFIFASSSSVYGDCPRLPLREDEPQLQPLNPYGLSKLYAEQACAREHAAAALDYAALRIFSAYGPGMRPDLGMVQFWEALRTGSPLSLRGDGSSQRDYTWVGDVCQAFISALRVLETQGGGHICNVGTGQPVSLLDLVQALAETAGYPLHLHHIPAEPAEMKRTAADTRHAQEILGFRAQVQIREGLQALVKALEAAPVTADTPPHKYVFPRFASAERSPF